MKHNAPRTALLALGTSALGACSLLFADAGTAPVAGLGPGTGDSGVDAGGEAGPTIAICGTADAGCQEAEDRGFPRDGLGGEYAVLNVAIGLQGSDFYAIVQGITSSKGAVVNRGQSSWGQWPQNQKPTDIDFQSHELCGNNPQCLGPAHVVPGNSQDDLSLIFTNPQALGGGCISGAISRRLPLGELNKGVCVGGTGALDDAVVLYGLAQAQGYLGGAKFHLKRSVDPVVDFEASQEGMWAGTITNSGTSKSYAVYNDTRGLSYLDILYSNVTPAPSLFGKFVAFPDVATHNGAAYIGGLSSRNGGRFVLEKRSWDRRDANDGEVDIEPLVLVPPPSPPERVSGNSTFRRPFHPMLVRANERGRLRLVALSRTGGNVMNCNLHAFVQSDTSPSHWNKYALASAQCADLSFDAALDSIGNLHVLYGTNIPGDNVGYKVITP